MSVFFLSKPKPAVIDEFLRTQQDLPFSYSKVGASRTGQTLRGYDTDHHRVQLGIGADAFEKARAALRRWRMFNLPWLSLCWRNTPIQAGATVAVLAAHLGFWSLNACRIVYVIEEHEQVERYGFAYGTLPQHGERGEERFTIEFLRSDNSVWYDIYALSRPRLAAGLVYPYARMLQRRFAEESINAMKTVVKA